MRGLAPRVRVRPKIRICNLDWAKAREVTLCRSPGDGRETEYPLPNTKEELETLKGAEIPETWKKAPEGKLGLLGDPTETPVILILGWYDPEGTIGTIEIE